MSQKHIVIQQNVSDSLEEEQIKKLLSVDWGTVTLGAKCPSKNGFHILDKKTTKCQFKLNWRLPWDMFDETNLYKMNYHVTISPDPIHQDPFYQKKYAHMVLRLFLDELKKNGLYKNIIVVYEYGPRGKKYGKLHWHMLMRTHKIRKVEETANAYFATSKKRSKFTTVIKRITIDKNYAARSDQDKVDNYRLQVDTIFRNYFRKETHNKKKCLYTDMRKSE